MPTLARRGRRTLKKMLASSRQIRLTGNRKSRSVRRSCDSPGRRFCDCGLALMSVWDGAPARLRYGRAGIVNFFDIINGRGGDGPTRLLKSHMRDSKAESIYNQNALFPTVIYSGPR